MGAGRMVAYQVGALRSPLLVSRLVARDASWMRDVIRAANTTPPFSTVKKSNSLHRFFNSIQKFALTCL